MFEAMFANYKQNASEIMNYLRHIIKTLHYTKVCQLNWWKCCKHMRQKLKFVCHFEALANVGKAIFVSYKFRCVHFMTSFFSVPHININVELTAWFHTHTTCTYMTYTFNVCIFILLLKWINVVTIARHIIKSYRWTLTATKQSEMEARTNNRNV